VKIFGKPISATISRILPGFHPQDISRRDVFSDGANNTFWRKYLSFLKYAETPFNRGRPRFRGASIFSCLLTYLPTALLKDALRRTPIVVVDEVDFVAARPHCKSPSFIVGHQRTVSRVENRPGTEKRSRQIGGWTNDVLLLAFCARASHFFRYSPS